MKLNGHEIPKEAVEHELNRLIRFYVSHGMPEEQLRSQLHTLKARLWESSLSWIEAEHHGVCKDTSGET